MGRGRGGVSEPEPSLIFYGGGAARGLLLLLLSRFSRVRLGNPMDYSLPGSSVHGDSPGKNTGVCVHLDPLGSTPGLHYFPQPLLCPRGSLHPSFQPSFSRSWILGAEEPWAWGR